MTLSVSDVAATAKQLATWLGTWRVLLMIFGALGILASLFALMTLGAIGSEMGIGGTPIMLLLLLLIVGIGLSVWINSMLLGWGKDWVEQASHAAEQGSAPHGLSETRANLDKWLGFIIWGTLAYFILLILIFMGMVSTFGALLDEGIGAGILGIGLVIILPVFVVMFLINTYFPLTSLRNFMAQATARLQGGTQSLQPAAKSVNVWMWVLVALQVANLIFSIPNLFAGEDSLGIGAGLLALIISLGMAALYIIPLLLTGKFAKLLAERLDMGQPMSSQGGYEHTSAPLRDYSSMGRMVDSLDETPRR